MATLKRRPRRPSRPGHTVAWKRAHPWTGPARRSRKLRRQLNKQGRVTPNFGWSEFQQTAKIPTRLRKNTIRHAWELERLKHELTLAAAQHFRPHPVAITIDGGYRTVAHNQEVGGAQNSRHTFGDASDHFVAQVSRWCRETGLNRGQVIAICNRIFKAVGDEASDTLHLDSRPGPIVRFTTWISATGQRR